MNFLLVLFLLLSFAGTKIQDKSKTSKDYLNKENTDMIKGLFVLLIFFSHFGQNIDLKSDINYFLGILRENQRQLIVAPFFFYMGYGLSEKGKDNELYLKKIIIKIINLFLQFDLAVLLYVVANFILGNKITIEKILLSLIGIKAVENSNWFFVTTICLYIIYYLTYKLIKSENFKIIIITLASVTLIYLMILLKKPEYWYNTIMAYPFGFVISRTKKTLDGMPFYKNEYYFFILLILFIMFYYSYTRKGIICYELNVVAFCAIIMILSMRIQIGNSFLSLLKEHSFSIYILQKLPMYVLKHLFDAQNHIYIYFFCCFFSTIIMSIIYDKLWFHTSRKWKSIINTKL